MSLLNDIQVKFKTLNAFEKLIAINVAIFIVFRLFGFLFKVDLISFLMLPENLDQLIFRPWTLFTYMFIHASLMHILFNMIWLYFASRIFLNFLPAKTGLNVYFLGGLLGALLYIVSYNLF